MKKLSAALAALQHDTIRTAARRRVRNSPALMTHVVAGYPTLRESEDIVIAMADAGASFIEIQIPFSDPIADGPTIMAASEAALQAGVRVKDCLKLAERLSKRVAVPLLFMTYFNILYRYHQGKHGVRSFCRDAAGAGIEGLIVPDLPPEEERVEGYWHTARDEGLFPIPIVSPTSDLSRLTAIKSLVTEGFVYCVSTTGTTGARSALPKDLSRYIARVRSTMKLPLAVGFGISSPEQVRALSGIADIAIVGSAMLDRIGSAPAPKRISVVREFTRNLAFG